MKMPVVLSTVCALALVASTVQAQQNEWEGFDPNTTTKQHVLRPSPDPQFSTGTTVYRPGETVVQSPTGVCCPTTTTVLSPTIVEAAPLTVYRPSTVTYYSPPVTVYRPAPVTYFRPAPATVFSPVVVVRSKVYVPGQPIRNFFKAITP